MSEHRDSPRAARRAAILSVAWAVFREHGYGGGSMSLIAERLGGSKGTLYKYFASKEELLLAVARTKGEELYRKFQDLPVPEGDFAEVLANLGCQMINIVMSDDYLTLYRLIIAEATRVPIIGAMAYESRRSTLLAPLQGHIEAALGKKQLQLVDPVEAAETFWELCSATLNRRALLAIEPRLEQADIQKIANRAVAFFLAIYGPGKGKIVSLRGTGRSALSA